jgi:hypothetical protein
MAIASTGIENPRGRALDKRVQVLRWMNRWGYCTPKILAEMLDLAQPLGRRVADQMIKKGILKEVLPGGHAGYSKLGLNRLTGKMELQGPYLLMLTEAGKSTAMAIDGQLGATWERQISGVQSINHNLVTQRFTAHMLNFAGFHDFIPEAMTRTASQSGKKQPDVLLINNQERVAIEIELTPKSETTGALDRALEAVASGISLKEFDRLIYVFGSDSLLNSYKKKWDAGRIDEWKIDRSRYEKTGKFWQIPADTLSRVTFSQNDFLNGLII